MDRAVFSFLDLEMTGTVVEADRIVEVCVERWMGAELVGRLETLVRPDPIDPKTDPSFGAAFHGLSPEVVSTAPTFADVMPELLRLLEGSVFVAHAAKHDVAFLHAELSRLGKVHRVGHFLDTLVLSRRAFALTRHSLAALCESFGIPQPVRHRAGPDVEALRKIFQHIVETIRPKTPRDLWHVHIGARRARPDIIDACGAAVLGREPVWIRYRPSKRGAEDVLFHMTALRTELDPPVVLGYLLPSRSRRTLRVDRILAIRPRDQRLPPL